MSGWLSDKGWGGDLASPGPIGNVTPNTGAFTTLSATTSVTSPIVKANGSGGGTLQSNNGTACLQWGAGGGSNVTFDGGASALDNIIISTAGKGISFSGVTPPAGMTSQLLSDYEEGTFTPVVIGSTTAGTANYGRNAGFYTKIGRAVAFSIDLDWSAGTGTGNLQFSGLPFTSKSGVNTGIPANFVIVSLTANCYLQGWLGGSSTTINAMQSAVGGGSVTSVAYSGNGTVMLSGVYIV